MSASSWRLLCSKHFTDLEVADALCVVAANDFHFQNLNTWDCIDLVGIRLVKSAPFPPEHRFVAVFLKLPNLEVADELYLA